MALSTECSRTLEYYREKAARHLSRVRLSHVLALDALTSEKEPVGESVALIEVSFGSASRDVMPSKLTEVVHKVHLVALKAHFELFLNKILTAIWTLHFDHLVGRVPKVTRVSLRQLSKQLVGSSGDYAAAKAVAVEAIVPRQGLDAFAGILKSATGIGLRDAIGVEHWHQIRTAFEVRHLVEHRNGNVDDKFLTAVESLWAASSWSHHGEPSKLDKVPVDEEDVKTTYAAMLEATSRLVGELTAWDRALTPAATVQRVEIVRPASAQRPGAIICADWAMNGRDRAVYVALVDARSVKRIPPAHWTFDDVLREAQLAGSGRPILVAFDVPLGVPATYFAAAAATAGERFTSFLHLLKWACRQPRFFETTLSAQDWTISRPFFHVPAGPGGLSSYDAAAARANASLLRLIDTETGAKRLFAKSGIPGSVGSAACALWQELGAHLTEQRQFRIWPFDGDLESLLSADDVVVGEIYPRAAYATALIDGPIVSRARLALGKSHEHIRAEALESLKQTEWVKQFNVRLDNLSEARANENDFDALMTAAALLRCVLEGLPLCPEVLPHAESEGGMLGTGSINLNLPERHGLSSGREHLHTGGLRQSSDRIHMAPPGVRLLQCPIPNCAKVYWNGRGGWDAHVASLKKHPDWRPELRLPEERKRAFEREFPEFFASQRT